MGQPDGREEHRDEQLVGRVVLQKSTAVHFIHQNFGKLNSPQAGSGS